jgi:hypothetical protein
MSDNHYLVPGSNKVSRKKQEYRQTNKGSPYSDYQLNINESDLKTASKHIKERADMNSDIMKLVPEIKQCKEIILSSMVSPNDFSKRELLPYYDNILSFSDTVVNKIKTLISTSVARYNMVDTLYDISEEALFMSGADIELIMPRSMINNVIKDSMIANANVSNSRTDLENFNPANLKLENEGLVTIDVSKSIKHTINKVDYEAKLEDFNIEYTGNPLAITINDTYKKATESIMDNIYYGIGVDKESIDKETLSIYDKYKKFKTKQFINIGDATNKQTKADLPFIMKMSSSATMPIYIDKPSNHVGYISLVDEMFNGIIHTPKESELVNSLMNFNTTNKSNVISSILSKASTSLEISKDAPLILSNMLEVTEAILLQTVEKSIDKSIFKSKVEIAEENSLVRIMLYRALNNMKTRMIFIPKQYISYIAFDYRPNGTGKTLLEDIALLASFKAMLTLSEIYAAVNKNIPVTDIIATIDDQDPEPFKTKEIMEQDIYTTGNRRMIWGETSIEKHINWINNSRFQIKWVNKKFPDNNIEVVTKNKDMDYTVDTETGDKVMRSIIKSLGLVPSALDDSENVEFASVEMLKNALFNKINTERQDTLSIGVSDRLRKYILSDSVMLESIYDLIDSNASSIISMLNNIQEDDKKITKLDDGIKLQILKDIVDCIYVKLPMAENNIDIDNMKDKFENYKESIEGITDILKESTYGKEVIAELGIDENALVANIKLYMIIEWCEEHNYAKGIVSFINTKEVKDLKRIFNSINSKDANIIKLAKSIAKEKAKILEKLQEEEPNDEEIIQAGEETPPANEGLGDEELNAGTEPKEEDFGDEDEIKKEESEEPKEEDLGSEEGSIEGDKEEK